MRHLVSAMLVLVGIIHLLPVSGVLGGERLAQLYGLRLDDINLVILMRHRAVLFALLGALLIVAAFRPSLQPTAFIAAFVSVISFLWLAGSADSYNAAIARVVVADWVALGCLAIGVFAWLLTRRSATWNVVEPQDARHDSDS